MANRLPGLKALIIAGAPRRTDSAPPPCSTLLVAGRNDKLVPRDETLQIAPGAQTHVHELGHSLPCRARDVDVRPIAASVAVKREGWTGASVSSNAQFSLDG